MVFAVVFSLAVVSAGFAGLRTLGLAKGAIGIGLSPAAGLAILTVVSTWTIDLGLPPPLPGVLVLSVAMMGLGLAARDRQAIGLTLRTVVREQRLALALLLTALLVPLLVTGFAFAGVEVPLSPHDGAAHTETIQAFRLGHATLSWYPPGLAALFGACLELFPWLDSAKGAFELGTSLPVLAALACFGLGVAVWHDMRMAATSALLLGLTYLYPYFPEVWSGWPLAMSLVLVMGVWTIAIHYLERPSPRWAVLAGVVMGAVVLVHGSELYTLLLVMSVVLVGAWPRVVWRNLPWHVGLATVLGLVCAGVYLPALFNWAGAGGAYAVGLADGAVPQSSGSVSVSTGHDLFFVFGLDSLGIDLPVRLGLLLVGMACAFRQRVARSLVVVGFLFAAIACIFTFFSSVPLIRQVYASVFPWGMHYRLFMVVAVVQVLLAGAGGMVMVRWLGRRASTPGLAARLLRTTMRVLVPSWLALAIVSMTVFMMYPTGQVLGYTTDDVAAMTWLRQNAAPGEIVVNDGYADAGIWAPYKAGVTILEPRTGLNADDLLQRNSIVDNVARLDQSPEAAAAACALNAHFVYRGARASEWDVRRLPELAVLRQSPALEEVFTRGDAAIFRTKLNCGA
jgi:hypothetical protein